MNASTINRTTLYRTTKVILTNRELLRLLNQGKNLKEAAESLGVHPSVVSKTVTELKELGLVIYHARDDRQDDESKYEVNHYNIGRAITLSISIWGMVYYDQNLPQDNVDVHTNEGVYMVSETVIQYMHEALKMVNENPFRYLVKVAGSGKPSTTIQTRVSKKFDLGESTVRLHLKKAVDLGILIPIKNGKSTKYEVGEVYNYLLNPRVPTQQERYSRRGAKKFTGEDFIRNMKDFTDRNKA